ncbi:MAG: anti-sigma factor [Vulcanimicrobiota bacterium]
MSCEHSHRVSLYHDGQLASEQAEEVRGHLGSCLTCRRYLGSLGALEQALQLPEVEPLPTRHFATGPSPRPWKTVAAAALIGAALLGGWPARAPATKTYAIKADGASYTISTRGEVELLSIGLEDVEASFSLE